MSHEIFIQRCIQLAENGCGTVSPNPMVGCVIVNENKIIAEDWHQKAGEPHAERAAISKISNDEILSKSTLYVNLEPCNHFGKTPPCADLILEKKIPKVVIGSRDPNENAKGGIEKLRENGVEVIEEILKDDCLFLNRRFYTFHEKKRPYVILKWAQTQDGFLDRKRNGDKAKINWITQPQTQVLTHRWRTEEDAILVGKNTVLDDNPSLTARAFSGKNPIRLILGKKGDLPAGSKIFDKSAETIFFTEKNLQSILNQCFEKKIQSLIVEGGAKVLQSFIDENLWDEARVLTGNSHFGDGLKAPQLDRVPTKIESLGTDQLKVFYQ